MKGRGNVRDVLAIEVTGSAIRCLRVGGIGLRRGVRAYAERCLPPGVLIPSTSLANVRDEAAFSQLLVEVIGPRPPRWARLVLPDRSVRLQVLNSDAALPAGPDLHRFLVWRLQDALAFDPREARVAYLSAPNGLPGRQVAVTLVAREQVVVQYERLVRGAGTGVAHVAPASCHLFNLTPQETAADERAVAAFLALAPDSATVILSLKGIPHYARTFLRPFPPPPADAPPPSQATARPKGDADLLVHLVEELGRSFHHAEEEMGLGLPASLRLAGELGHDPTLAAALQEQLGTPCFLPAPLPRLPGSRSLPPSAQTVLGAALGQL